MLSGFDVNMATSSIKTR